jgi:hypothetical protein
MHLAIPLFVLWITLHHLHHGPVRAPRFSCLCAVRRCEQHVSLFAIFPVGRPFRSRQAERVLSPTATARALC